MPTLSQVPASPASVVGLQLVEGMLEGEPHKFTPHSIAKCPAWQCLSSAPTPAQGGPGSSGWRDSPRGGGEGHWAPSHCFPKVAYPTAIEHPGRTPPRWSILRSGTLRRRPPPSLSSSRLRCWALYSRFVFTALRREWARQAPSQLVVTLGDFPLGWEAHVPTCRRSF